jgi:hypothetical protein
MEKIKPKGVWRFERSSGYAGYRCQKCNTWIYCGAEAICDCNNSLPIEDMWFNVYTEDGNISKEYKEFTAQRMLEIQNKYTQKSELPIEDTTILSPNEVIKLYRKAYREGYLTPSMFLKKLNELVKEKTTTNGRV